jgi:hypothetical protein
VQEGNKCFCGSQYGFYGNATDNKCDSRCTDTTAKGKCGGTLHNSIYENVAPPSSSPASSIAAASPSGAVPPGLKYVGCFLDQQNPMQALGFPVFFCPMGLQYCPGETPVINGMATSCAQPEALAPPQCQGVFDSDACARFKGPSSGDFPLLTIEMCEAVCSGHKYFGLYSDDSHGKCFCGQNIVISPTAFGNGTLDKCSRPCAGDKTQKCGGPGADGGLRFLSIYTSSSTDVSVTVEQVVEQGEAPHGGISSSSSDQQDGLVASPSFAASHLTLKSLHGKRKNRRSRKKLKSPPITPICRSHSCVSTPTELDWQAKGGVVTAVKDQGKACNASWAFAAVGAIESASALATGKLLALSEQELLDCAWNYGLQSCRGGSVDRAFRYAAEGGLCTNTSYAYTGEMNRCCGSSMGLVGVPGQEDRGMQAYCAVQPMNETELVGALQFRPVAVGLAVDEAFMTYTGGVMNSKATVGQPLNHAALLVGYTASYWRIKNSFGPSWGEGGYGRLARGVDDRAGQYGILTSPSYPVVIAPPKQYPKPMKPHHYDKPPCKPDEAQLAVTGINGTICTHTCSPSQTCPENSGKGSDAQIKCALQDAKTGQGYCAVICTVDCDCAQTPSPLTCQKSPSLPFGICAAPGQPAGPTPPPTPPPPPSNNYEDPKHGCHPSETKTEVKGVSGSFCSPPCGAQKACPGAPVGTTAKPQCAITQASGAQSCALVCTPSDSSDAQCGTGTSCKAIQGTGICTYDDDDDSRYHPRHALGNVLAMATRRRGAAVFFGGGAMG